MGERGIMSRRKHRSDSPATPLKVLTGDAPAQTPSPPPRRNYARWRAISLSLVYLVFAAHIIHWKITGRTLAPLELNEVMYTLELGIITAGFIFMAALVVGTLFFGRFFCSWACHIMVLQDACSWLLQKLRIRPKQVRSRLLLIVPPLTALYMFVWPQIVRMWRGGAIPTFHFATDADGWASLATTNFWRNLPGPWVIVITFFVCGFAIVYVLGSRSFCTYVCPYGAVFAFADRFSPGRIRVNDSCEQCGRCTGVCSSGIRVHEEIHQHGIIVNPACLKDLDCVSVCPQQALSYGIAKPAFFSSRTSGGRFGLPYDFTLSEELFGAVVFLFTTLSFRGLYGRVPFLLSLALAAIATYVAITSVRLTTHTHVSMAALKLKLGGKFTFSGTLFVPVAFLFAMFLAHSAFIRYHEYSGLRAIESARQLDDSAKRTAAAKSGDDHLAVARRWSLLANPHLDQASLLAAELQERDDIVGSLARQILRDRPGDVGVRLSLAKSLMHRDRSDEAAAELRRIVDLSSQPGARRGPELFAAHDMLGSMDARSGHFDLATEHFEQAVSLRPNAARVRAGYGAALAEMGRLDDAILQLQEATRLDGSLDEAGYNLGTLLMHLGRYSEAIPYLEGAMSSYSRDVDALNNLGMALTATEAWKKAEPYLRRAIDLQPNHADAHFNLARLLAQTDRPIEAQRHLLRAADLDQRYAALLNGNGESN